MSNITNDQILETAYETIEWAKELSELWTNTTTGNILDMQTTELENALKSNDLELTQKLMTQLAQSCVHAEKEYQD